MRAVGEEGVGKGTAADRSGVCAGRVEAQVVVKAHVADRERTIIDIDVRAIECIGYTPIIAGVHLAEWDIRDQAPSLHSPCESKRAHSLGDRLRCDPGGNNVVGVQWKMVVVIMPWRASAPRLLGEEIVVVETNTVDPEEVRTDFCNPRAEDKQTKNRVFQPDHFGGIEPAPWFWTRIRLIAHGRC